ncbi:Protein kinase domain containing protein [Metarhizium guizhouense ARSEF 977]|uniref:Protein kinase domain containing protein n=1 Tax=Metarhizium guizhouense (strain ARSEF 977) TaxID=1276136 RepID=A0A0B4GVA2_METGA|nr:Protein kinase domain containing protein [Metarhizium guizhouense ARSEF 977]
METSTSLQGQLDTFLYTGAEGQFEDLTKYKQNGLHPITLGDVLPKPSTCVGDVNKAPRYRIMLKLGSGAFATVWLARDLVEKRYVAVKVGLGSDIPRLNRETEILTQLCKAGPGKHGHQRVIELFDVYIMKGPNGFHQCLVTEVISPLSDPDARQQCSFAAIRQIIEGFAFLHGEGIVHGDPHIANFGIALPQLEQFKEDDITEYFANPEIIPVVPRDPTFPLDSVPPYIVQSVSIADFLQGMKAFPASSVMSIKILDFGRAHRLSKTIPSLPGAAPTAIRPPEVVLHELSHGRIGCTWSEAADIWAVGCTLYHVKSGHELISTWGSLKDYLFRAIQFGGPPPETWPQPWNKQDRKHENSPLIYDRVKVWEAREATRNSCRGRNDEERSDFLNLIKKMILTNPDERSLMAVLLTDPFMRAVRRKEDESI